LKLATFEIPTLTGPTRRIGAAVSGRLIDFQAAYAAHLDRVDPGCDACKLAALLFPSDIVTFLGWGTLGMDAARHSIDVAARTEEAFGARTSYAPDEVRLLAPVVRPRVLRDLVSFEGHLKGVSKALGWQEGVPPAWYEVPAYYKGDPDTVVRMIARVNGEVWTDSSSAGRHYSFADLIAHVSQSQTIYPGEVWCGNGNWRLGAGTWPLVAAG
jgi:hypothetical protein